MQRLQTNNKLSLFGLEISLNQKTLAHLSTNGDFRISTEPVDGTEGFHDLSEHELKLLCHLVSENKSIMDIHQSLQRGEVSLSAIHGISAEASPVMFLMSSLAIEAEKFGLSLDTLLQPIAMTPVSYSFDLEPSILITQLRGGDIDRYVIRNQDGRVMSLAGLWVQEPSESEKTTSWISQHHFLSLDLAKLVLSTAYFSSLQQ